MVFLQAEYVESRKANLGLGNLTSAKCESSAAMSTAKLDLVIMYSARYAQDVMVIRSMGV